MTTKTQICAILQCVRPETGRTWLVKEIADAIGRDRRTIYNLTQKADRQVSAGTKLLIDRLYRQVMETQAIYQSGASLAAVDRFGLPTQPAPITTPRSQRVLDAVLTDLQARAEKGRAQYGCYLQTFNGRNPLQDAYEEALDLAMYLKQAILESEASRSA